MSTTTTLTPVVASPDDDSRPSDRHRLWTFWEWCLFRSVSSRQTQVALMLPLVIVAFAMLWTPWFRFWYPNQGRDLLRFLFIVASFAIVVGGGTHAAQAVCWEISHESRELVRLTGIGPLALLMCKSVTCWLTIGCSLLLLWPVVCFAGTLGIGADQFWSCGWGLLVLGALTSGMASIAAVSATDSENASSAAMSAVLILLVMYHLLYVFAATFVYLGFCCVGGELGRQIPFESWWRIPYDFAWQSTPISVLIRANFDPRGFTPLAPTYWIHFVVAVICYRMAGIVMVRRLRSNRPLGTDVPESITAPGGSISIHRPKCVGDPFFWKDAHVLAGGTRSQHRWSVTYLCWALGILVAGSMGLQWQLPVVMGVLTVCALPLIFAMRQDALFAAEIRLQTWESLMLLPIDRRKLFWAKFRAVAWEQRSALLPAGVAMVSGGMFQPLVLISVGVIAVLIGILACQVLAISRIGTRHASIWGILAAVLLILIGACLSLCSAFEFWVGFGASVSLTIGAIFALQAFLKYELQAWSES